MDLYFLATDLTPVESAFWGPLAGVYRGAAGSVCIVRVGTVERALGAMAALRGRGARATLFLDLAAARAFAADIAARRQNWVAAPAPARPGAV